MDCQHTDLSSRVSEFMERLFDADARTGSPDVETLFRDVFAIVSTDPSKRDAIVRGALDSHVHGNGFQKLVLYATDCGRFRLRVHVWEGAALQPATLNVHDHRYDFASFVCRGRMNDVTWTLDPEGEERRRFHYTPRTAGGVYGMKFTGMARLRVANVRNLQAGDLYRLRSDELHYSQPVGDETVVTLFAEDRRRLRPDSTTYSTAHPLNEEHVEAPALKPADYLLKLSRALGTPVPACAQAFDENDGETAQRRMATAVEDLP